MTQVEVLDARRDASGGYNVDVGRGQRIPPDEEVVLVSGVAPIRARKARYFEDPQLKRRILAPPEPKSDAQGIRAARIHSDNWAGRVIKRPDEKAGTSEGGLRREPEIAAPDMVAVPSAEPARNEFDGEEAEPGDEAVRLRTLARQAQSSARQVAMDPYDDMDM